MNLVALKAAKNDLVASVFTNIMANWAKEPGLVTWKKNLEVAYHHTKRQGTTIGLFSNLAGKLGGKVDDLPFFQIQAERLPFKLMNVEGWKVNFGINEYLGSRYNEVAALLVPFLTYATVLYHNKNNLIWNIEVGDWTKREPLVITFATPQSLVKLALWGHILVSDATLIGAHTPLPIPLQVPDFDEAQLKVFDQYSDERIIHELMRNRHGKPIFWGPAHAERIVGTYDNVRLENGYITLDAHLIDPTEWHSLEMGVVIIPRQRYDTKRSGRKYTKRYITPHKELEVRLLVTIAKE